MSSEPSLKYGRCQRQGIQLQQWMNEPSSSKNVPECKVQPCKLKFEQLVSLARFDQGYSAVQIEEFKPAGINDDDQWKKVHIIETDPELEPGRDRVIVWEGLVAPGILAIEEIVRKTGPYSSEIAHAVYENFFPVDTLEQVFIMDVQNENTDRFIVQELYTEVNGLGWPDEEVRYWQRDTPEFNALLGTDLGKVVASLVLGAFERGTRRISQIAICFSLDLPQLRFDIEKISPLPSVSCLSPGIRDKVKRNGKTKHKGKQLLLRNSPSWTSCKVKKSVKTKRKMKQLLLCNYPAWESYSSRRAMTPQGKAQEMK